MTANERNEMTAAHTAAADLDAIQAAEDRYTEYVAQAEEAPHQWGEEQEQEAHRLALDVSRLYRLHNIPAEDRIVGI